MRAILAVVAALLIAVQVVRSAAVSALAETRPAEAAKLWNGHPASEIGVAMTGIAQIVFLERPAGAGPRPFERTEAQPGEGFEEIEDLPFESV